MRRLVIGIIALTAASPSVRAQSAPPAPRLPGLVWTAYPELRDVPLQWRDGPEPGAVTIAVLTAEPGDPAVVSRPRDAALVATLELDDAGAVQRLRYRGPLTREDARAAVIALHGSSRTTLGPALRDAGARYGPDDAAALEAALPLDALARQLGTLRLGRTAFDEASAPLLWTVELLGEAGITYQMTVEPFAGRIAAIVRLGGAP
jgi:hypothetical protein